MIASPVINADAIFPLSYGIYIFSLCVATICFDILDFNQQHLQI